MKNSRRNFAKMVGLGAFIAPFMAKAQEKLRLLKKGFKVEADKDR